MKTVPLGELVDIKGGGTPSKDVEAYWGGDIPWASVKDFKSSEIATTVDSITSEGVDNSATHVIPANSILVPTRMAVGKAAINTIPMAINQDLKALTPRKGVDLRYLLHALLTKAPELEKQATGATVKGITLDVLKSLEIPLPQLEEQKRIAAILDQADELRRKRQRALDRLNQLGQAIFIEMFGDPQTNPFGLSQCVLGDVVHSASDGPHVSPTYADSGIPFLSTRHVKPGEILWRDLKYLTVEDAEVQWKKCRPQIGDLLYTKGGTTGIAAVVDTENPFAVWVHLALLKTNQAKVEPLWLETMLNCDFCYRQSQTLTHGIANRDLGLKRMVNIKMYLPSLDDQRKFVERLHVVRAMRSNMRLAEEAGQSFFASLQHRAFSGELTASSLKEAAA